MALFHDPAWRARMTVRFDVNGMMASVIDAAGIKEEAINALMPRMQKIQADLQSRRQTGALPFYDLPYQTEDIARVKALAETVKSM